MSDILDALGILAKMTEDMADYSLNKAKFEGAKQHEIDMFNRKMNAENARVNINTTLNRLNDTDKSVRERIRTTSTALQNEGINALDIIRLPEHLQTKDGTEIEEGLQQEYITDLTMLSNSGANVSETIANMQDAGAYNQYILKQLDLLSGINTRKKEEFRSKAVSKGDDGILKVEDFNGAMSSLVMEDDPLTKGIDESAMGTGYTQDIINKRIKEEGDAAKSATAQINVQIAQQKMIDDGIGAMYHVNTDRDGKEVGRNLFFTTAQANDAMNDGADMFLAQGISAFDPEADATSAATSQAKMLKAELKLINDNFTGSIGNMIRGFNSMFPNIDAENYGKDPTHFYGGGDVSGLTPMAIPAETSYQTPDELKLNINNTEENVRNRLLSALTIGYNNNGLSIISGNQVGSSWMPRVAFSNMKGVLVDSRSEAQVQFEEALEAGRFYTDDAGNKGLMEMILGMTPAGDEFAASSPDINRWIDKSIVNLLDLGGAGSAGNNESYIQIYQLAGMLKYISEQRGKHHDILGNYNTPRMNEAGDQSDHIGKNELINMDVNKYFDIPMETNEASSTGVDININKQNLINTSNQVEGSKGSITLDDFANSIGDKFDAKAYAGGFQANSLYIAAKNYKSNPTAKNKAKLEAFYRKYVK